MAKPRKPSKITMGPIHAIVRRARPPKGPADGRWYWQARYWSRCADAERTAWSGWATREEAEAILRALDPAKLDLETQAPKKAHAAPETIKGLLERWKADIEARGTLSVYTIRAYNTRLIQLVAGLGDVLLDRADRPALERYRAQRLREEAAASTLNKELVVLGTAWAWGREVGVCPDRSLPHLRRVEEVPVRNRRTPTSADVAAVLRRLDGWPRVALYLLCATGCRIGGIATLQRTSVDLDEGEITVTEKGKTRSVVLPDEAVTLLRGWMGATSHDYVLGTSPAVVRGHLWKHIADACEAAKVTRFSPHGLRRAAVDQLLRAGVEPSVAAKHMGHSEAVMLRVYRQVTEDDRRKAIKRARLGSLPKVDDAPG